MGRPSSFRSIGPLRARALATLVVLAAAAGQGCGGDDDATTPAAGPAPGPVQRGVTYRHARDHAGRRVALKLDLFKPDTAGPPGGRAAIVWLFGGGFVVGKREDMEPYATAMADRGFVSATADYRLATPTQIRAVGFDEVRRAAAQDGAAAVRWIKRHARRLGVDRRRVFIGGYSAGAVTTLAVATGSRAAPAGGVVIAGRVDPAEIDAGDAPLLWFHGRADQTVPFREAVADCGAAHRVGLECRLLPQPGGHEIVQTRFDVIVRRTAPWLRRH
jgi:acetyl esterase/lipase